MKRLALLLLLLCSTAALGQNFTAVSGSKTQDAGGNLLATGQICFIGTDQNDNVIGYQVGGGGQAIKVPVCSGIISGVITGFNVANPATTSPSGIYYRVTITDSSSGQEILRYKQVTFSGASFVFDNYVPIVVGNFAPLTGNSVSGNLGVTGNVTATGTVQGSQIISTTSTGTPPFTVTSTSVVSNLNANFLLGQSWTNPGTIGSAGPNTGKFTTLGTTGLVNLYNNIATAGIGLTPVYWVAGLTAQTASVGATNLTTTCPAGVYSATFYVKTTTAGTAGTVTFTLAWNDGAAMSFTSGTASLTSTALAGSVSGTQVVKCAASTTLSYSTTVSGATGSPQYSVDVAIEQVK